MFKILLNLHFIHLLFYLQYLESAGLAQPMQRAVPNLGEIAPEMEGGDDTLPVEVGFKQMFIFNIICFFVGHTFV